MSQLYFLSFADGGEKYSAALHRLKGEAISSGWFENVFALDAQCLADLNPAWYRRHFEFIAANKRLFGYCIWKPFAIAEMLRRIPDGAILIYSDAGAEISPAGVDRLRELVLITRKVGLVGFHTPYDVGDWTKGDLLRYFGYSLSDSVLSAKQLCANYMLIKNNPYNRALFNSWSEIVVAEDYRLVDDSPSVSPNPSGFVENRHDQAVFDLILRSFNYGLILPELEHTDNVLWAQGKYDAGKPIQQIRNLSGDRRLLSMID